MLFSLNSTLEDNKKHNQIKQIVFNIPLGLGFMPDQIVSIPFIPTSSKQLKNFTLVLDLDETLAHFFYTPSGGTFLIRPYAHEFLKQLALFYEIIIFTAAMKDVSI